MERHSSYPGDFQSEPLEEGPASLLSQNLYKNKIMPEIELPSMCEAFESFKNHNNQI